MWPAKSASPGFQSNANGTQLAFPATRMPTWFVKATNHNQTLLRLGRQCWASRICGGSSSCRFVGGDLLCGLERHSIHHIWMHLPPSATVLELGGRYGTVSCGISHRQAQSGLRLSLEPDATPFAAHQINVRTNGCAGHTLLAAASRVPLFFHPRATIPKAYGNHLRSSNCSKIGCEQRQTYTAAELAGVLSKRVGRTVKFDALVVRVSRWLNSILRPPTASFYAPW